MFFSLFPPALVTVSSYFSDANQNDRYLKAYAMAGPTPVRVDPLGMSLKHFLEMQSNNRKKKRKVSLGRALLESRDVPRRRRRRRRC